MELADAPALAQGVFVNAGPGDTTGTTGVLAVDLVNASNLDAPDVVRAELASGRVDERLVAVLAALTARHSIRVSVIKTGHPMGSQSPAGRENDHYFFRAADITAMDGVAIGKDPEAAVIVEVGRYLMSLKGNARPARVMGPARWLAALGDGNRTGFRDDAFAVQIHADHLHIGF